MNFKVILLTSVLLSATAIFANVSTEKNTTVSAEQMSKVESNKINQLKINQLLIQKENIENELLENNIWSKIYSNYHTYKELKDQQGILAVRIQNLKTKKKLSRQQRDELNNKKAIDTTLRGKLRLLKEYEEDPFKKFLTPPEITSIPTVGNPFAILGALSYIKKLKLDNDEYSSRYHSLENIVDAFREKKVIIKKLLKFDVSNTNYISSVKDIEDQMNTFAPVLEIFKTTENVYSKKIEETKLNIQNDIQKEMGKTIFIGSVILFFVLVLFFIKYLVRKYMSDNDKYYTINKALNITFMTILILTLLLAYIENVSYLVTILGFASAGIAIAMKDWFMSLMGWLTIIMGGAIHVGDRVKFVRDGVEYVGDIVDISMLRMTMHEDITLTTALINRRAGRMVFIPNNFIFTDMISNYSHSGLKTVWDGIDFVVTFDSDIHKASQIAKEVSKKYSKGYTDITRKQLNKLRSKYSMKNTNVEPRVFTFIEPFGMKISAWYLTNSYATLTLRSTISEEIILRLQEEDGINLAFPTQSIYVDKNVPKPQTSPSEIPPSSEIV